jgi:hypothetical protein
MRNLTKPLAAGVTEELQLISEFNSNNGGRARSSQEQQNDREGLCSQE